MEPQKTSQRLLRTPRAAAYLGLSASLLEKWRASGEGPPFARLGRVVVYDCTDLDTWIATLKTTVTAAKANPQ